MHLVAWIVVAAPVTCCVYAYALYPLLLYTASRLVKQPTSWPTMVAWPSVSITVPCYNEEASITATLEALLQVDYPADRVQIVVVSDASSDRTDDIVRGFAPRGVELLRMPERRGKSAAENAVALVCRGEILVNTDASIRIPRGSLKKLVAAFQDPTVGVASGRDASVSSAQDNATGGESGYVGYEMFIRSLETRVGSIVGASGCFYGIRKALHDTTFPEDLSRDFACALIARERGYRSVSVGEAIALVPRATSLDSEYRRKIRTMSRGLNTLWFKRALLNPFRYGRFAFMLTSHKLFRWLYYLLIPFALLALGILSVRSALALSMLVLGGAGVVCGAIGLVLGRAARGPARVFSWAAFVLASHAAGTVAWWRVITGSRSAMWEPTRRRGAPDTQVPTAT
ncbi:MAG TPA: glycosyltransferase [Gemmatimonadaceae bacterium]|nr:glycosyltransferase [Gemmatimonadaceae bacterium]